MKLEIISYNSKKHPDATPIVFIHGAWHSAWCWKDYLLDFSNKWGTSYAISFRGHGKSEGFKNLRWTRILDYVEDLKQFVDSLLPKKPIIVAHSMGAFVLQHYLSLGYPAKAAVLLAPVPPKGILKGLIRAFTRHPLAFLKVNLRLNPYHLIGSPSLAHNFLFSKNMSNDKINKYFKYMQDESYLALLEMGGLCLPKYKKVSTPLLVLGAENDAIIKPKEIKETAKTYHANFKIFPDMAHDMMLEKGSENVAFTIINWLKKQDF